MSKIADFVARSNARLDGIEKTIKALPAAPGAGGGAVPGTGGDGAGNECPNAEDLALLDQLEAREQAIADDLAARTGAAAAPGSAGGEASSAATGNNS